MGKGVAAAAAVLAVGCLVRGEASPSKPVVEFPSAARLAAVEGKSAKLPPIESGEVPPEGWTVEPPAPAPAPASTAVPTADTWSPRGPYEETFAAAYAASAREAALTRPMACAAAEIGRFFLEKQAAPPESLQSFLTAACGVFAPTVSYEWFKGQVPDRAPDEAVLPQWKNQIGSIMVGHLPATVKQAIEGRSALFDGPQAIGAIACGYRFHRDNDHTADVNHLLDRITAARQRMNLPPPVRLRGMDAVLRRELARVQEGKWTPMTALQASLQEASERNNALTRGIVVEATSLDALEIPPQVLSQSNLQLEVGVTHYKPPGAAWAQLVIIVVYVSPTGLAI